MSLVLLTVFIMFGMGLVAIGAYHIDEYRRAKTMDPEILRSKHRINSLFWAFICFGEIAVGLYFLFTV